MRERQPQARLHRPDRQIRLFSDGAVRQSFEKGQLHHFELLLRQGIEGCVHLLFALRCVKASIAGFGGIGYGEEILVRVAMRAAASSDIDAAVAGDAEDPGGGSRFAAIEQMRLAPDGFHHVLRDVGGSERSEPQPEHLGLHARSEMIEQGGKGLAVAVDANRRQEIVQLMGPGHRVLSMARRLVDVAPVGHAPALFHGDSARLNGQQEME